MADLYDGITASGETAGKISVHSLSAALREFSRGAVTKAQIVAAFNLDATQESNIDAIQATYQAKATQALKDDYLVKIHDVFILSEAKLYTKAKAKTELGF